MPAPPRSPEWPPVCHRCGAALAPGEGSFYVVRIEAMADPTPPHVDAGEPLADVGAEMAALVEQMAGHSSQELMDQVYRRLTLLLCAACYRRWIENPTG